MKKLASAKPLVEVEPAIDSELPAPFWTRYGGWGARAQKYPIFSQTWFKYRVRSFVLPVATFLLLMSVSVFVMPPGMQCYMLANFLYLCICIVYSLLIGRWLAVLVCKRKLTEKIKLVALIAVLVFGVASSFGIKRIGDRIEKEWRVEHLHEMDQDSIKYFEATQKGMNNSAVTGFNLLFSIALFTWLGGALDFVAYFRQQRHMKEELVAKKVARYKQERNEAELRLSVLASQIEPHFLFNTLAGVRSAISSDPQMGVALIDNLVEYLRATIPQIREDGTCSQVKLTSQLQAIQAYLGVIKFRIPRMSFRVECDPALREQFIPPLMLISLVENAVKHGIELKKGPVHIDVIAEQKEIDAEPKLVLSVIDNGLGLAGVTAGTGIGLANIRERLMQLYGDQAALSLVERDEGGVCASIVMPLSNQSTLSL